jgi:hypothetical protein
MLLAALRRFYPSSTRYIVRPLLLLLSYFPLPITLRSSSLPRVLLRLAVVAVVFWALSAAAGPVSRSSPLNIDRAPAPPPELGPPLSRNASRDKSLLGAQIGAIVGAYALFVFVLACYVALVGRRLRAYALGGPAASSDIEMGKASPTTAVASQHPFEASPVSPGTTAFANSASPSKAGTQGGHFAWPSPTKQNFTGVFDERVIQDDKAQRERDMERLYAAVMEHEAASASTSSLRDLRRGTAKDDSAVTAAGRPAAAAVTASSPKRKTPRFLRALTSPTLRSPTKSQASQASQASQPGSPLSPKQQKRKSKKDDEALQSLGTSGGGHRKGGIRGLSISKPVPTPTFSLQSRGPASDEEPLTPHHPPPSPPTSQDATQSTGVAPAAAAAAAAASASTDDIELALLGDPPSSSSTPVSSTGRPRVPALQLSKPRPRVTTAAAAGKSNSSLPLSPPQSPPPPSHQQQQQHHHHHYHQQQHHPQSSNVSLPASSSTSLPLRQQQLHNSPSTLPLRSLNTALGANPSASTTKVTIVERPERLSSAFLSPATAGGTRRATAGLRTGQPVPYSPYMPFTPVTPITPGLVTRRDRKAREKREERTADGHRARKVVTEMVKGDDELWSSGY